MVYTIAGRVTEEEEMLVEGTGSLSDLIPVLAEEITTASFGAADLDANDRITYDEFVIWLESDSPTAIDVRDCFSFLSLEGAASN